MIQLSEIFHLVHHLDSGQCLGHLLLDIQHWNQTDQMKLTLVAENPLPIGPHFHLDLAQARHPNHCPLAHHPGVAATPSVYLPFDWH